LELFIVGCERLEWAGSGGAGFKAHADKAVAGALDPAVAIVGVIDILGGVPGAFGGCGVFFEGGFGADDGLVKFGE